MKTYYIDCSKFCGGIITDDNDLIIDVPPLFKKFKGQKVTNLFYWISKTFGKVVWKELE